MQNLQDIQKDLPFLPGTDFRSKGLPNYRKSHVFDYCNDNPVFSTEKPAIGGRKTNKTPRKGTSLDIYEKVLHGKETAPSWIAFDRKVLRFYAYFLESVQERNDEQYRVRRVNIYFYLEDDSIQVIETRQVNSGMPQGTLIRRHRIPKSETGFYTVADLNVSQQVTLYAKTFQIVGCDSFTREFLEALNLKVPENTESPQDPYQEHRAQQLSRHKPNQITFGKAPLKKFLENDRKVLRFYCVWDDSSSVFGDVRNMVLNYFLADDTIEIREHIPVNSGRDNVALFLRRSKLPKRPKVTLAVNSPNATADSFYTERDLTIGAIIHLYGRPFIVCNCDEFTKEYYQDKFGIQDFSPIDFPTKQAKQTQQRIIPPYNGYGTEEDSLGSCLHLIPQPPKKPFNAESDENIKLRFSAILNTQSTIDRDRKFVISYFPSDNTFSIFESHQRNTGIVGGKFMERKQVKKQIDGSFVQMKDLSIGAELTFHGHPFKIIDADKFALNFIQSSLS